MIAAQFIQRIQANVRYWQTTAGRLTDLTLADLDKDRENLYRAVQFGLTVPETAHETAVLVSHLFGLIERRGYWQEWQPILEESLAACPETNLPLKLILLNQLGFVQRLRCKMEESIATHRKAISLAEQHNQPAARANSFFHLSNAFYECHQHSQARQLAEQALTAFESLGQGVEDKKMAAIYNLLGLLAQARGEYDVAADLFHQSITHWQQTDELTYLSRTLGNLGINLMANEQFAEALAYFDQASEVLEATASELDKSKIAINQGAVYFELGEWHKAEAAYLRANSPHIIQSGDKHLQALIANNLGCALMRQGCWAEADAYLRESVNLWQMIKNDLMLANARGSLGETAAALGRVELAKNYYCQAVDGLLKFPEDAFARSRLAELQSLLAQLD